MESVCGVTDPGTVCLDIEKRINDSETIVTTMNETQYFFNDPWNHHGVIGYPKDLVISRHKAQHEMAVAACR